jgi:deoxyribonucleoside regulator
MAYDIKTMVVNRILKRALGSGIVQINIIDPTTNISNLEEKLEKKFNLKRAIVVDNLGLSEIELKSKLGQAAVKYLLEVIKDGDIIGISWGTTINEVINYLPSKINKSVEVVQITGGSHQLSVNLNCHDITRRFALKFGVEPHLLYAPAIVDSKEVHDLLINETSIKETSKYFNKLTIAIVGIGAMYPKIISTLIKTGHIGKDDLVGDVYSHFFNKNGRICDSNLTGRLTGMPVGDLLKVPYSVGIAGGKLKAEAILGAIRGNYINIVITDSNAAEKILKLS